jgi:hypothetical protein
LPTEDTQSVTNNLTISQSFNNHPIQTTRCFGRTHFYHSWHPCTIRLPSSLVCLSLSLELRLNSASARALHDYFTCLHVLQFTGSRHKKLYHASFIILGEKEVLILLINLVRIMSCTVAPLLEESFIHFFHILHKVRKLWFHFCQQLNQIFQFFYKFLIGTIFNFLLR